MRPEVKNMANLNNTTIVEVEPVVDQRVRNHCRTPYPGHPRGCPNWGRETCPPCAPPLRKVLDLSRPIWLAVGEYDLAAHAERARARHPGWSDKALRNPRHWQGTARKALRLAIEEWALRHPDVAELAWLGCPEGTGVDVTETCRRAGIELEWPVVRAARQVALIGYSLEAE